MKRKIAALCILICLLSGAAVWLNVEADTPVSYNAEDIFGRSEQAVLYIRILREDDSLKATGTGVILSPEGLAATAYHVVKGAERIEGTLRDGRVRLFAGSGHGRSIRGEGICDRLPDGGNPDYYRGHRQQPQRRSKRTQPDSDLGPDCRRHVGRSYPRPARPCSGDRLRFAADDEQHSPRDRHGRCARFAGGSGDIA